MGCNLNIRSESNPCTVGYLTRTSFVIYIDITDGPSLSFKSKVFPLNVKVPPDERAGLSSITVAVKSTENYNTR
jgi:hypothetical protein